MALRNDWHIGVIGSGKMGSNIVEVLLTYEFPVVWIIRSEKIREEKKIWVAKKLNRQLKLSTFTSECAEKKLKQVTITGNYNELSNANIVIECVSENIETKRTVLKKIESAVTDTCIILSNTSSLPLSEIFADVEKKNRCAGMHFLYPVQLKKIVEINCMSQNDDLIISKIEQFAFDIEHNPLVLKTPHHFILNRIFVPYLAQAFKIVSPGILTVQELDQLVEEHLFAMGPFRLMDSVGIDVMLESLQQYNTLPQEKQFCQPLISALMCFVEHGYLGDKSGKGFYTSRNLVFPAEYHELYPVKPKQVIPVLAAVLINTIFSELEKGIVSCKQLFRAIDDYIGMGCDLQSLLDRQDKNGILEVLIHLQSETGNVVYQPSDLLKQWVDGCFVFTDQFEVSR